MSYSGTGQSAIKIFAAYCSNCIHRNVCAYADELRKHEERFKEYGTGTECYAPITVHCTEKRTDNPSKTLEIEPVLDYNGKPVWRCGDCGNAIFHPEGTGVDEDSMNHYRYCSHCGKPIKWTTLPYVHEQKKVFNFEHGIL